MHDYLNQYSWSLCESANFLFTNILQTSVDLFIFNTRSHSAVHNAYDCRFRGCKFESQLSLITFMEFDRDIICTIILPLLLIQVGLLSVLAIICTQVLVNH